MGGWPEIEGGAAEEERGEGFRWPPTSSPPSPDFESFSGTGRPRDVGRDRPRLNPDSPELSVSARDRRSSARDEGGRENEGEEKRAATLLR